MKTNTRIIVTAILLGLNTSYAGDINTCLKEDGTTYFTDKACPTASILEKTVEAEKIQVNGGDGLARAAQIAGRQRAERLRKQAILAEQKRIEKERQEALAAENRKARALQNIANNIERMNRPYYTITSRGQFIRH